MWLGRNFRFPHVWAVIALASSSFAVAETVIIESRSGGTNFAAYAEMGGNWQNSSAKSTLSDVTQGIGSRFATTDGATFKVTPHLQEGATYSVEVTHGTSSNIPTNLLASISQSGCTGLPAETSAFDQNPANAWRRVGEITVDFGVTNPVITFAKLPGASGAGQRFYADAIRFLNVSDPCLAGLPRLQTVNGPLAAGQTHVDVPSVDGSATTVTVYANGIQIGQITSGIVAGINRVPTSGLVKGQIVAATQTNPSGIESCRPAGGPVVGGGANPRIRVSLSIREDESLTGPIGADGGTPTVPLNFLGATNVTAGFGTAPAGGKVFQPSNGWQTVTFLRGPDPANPTDETYGWLSASDHVLRGDFGILDAVALAIDDLTDSGPFAIHIDNLSNGSTVIQDFESATNGQRQVQFLRPSAASGQTRDYLLAQPPGDFSPDVSRVTDVIGDDSLQSLVVSWQFKDTARADWVRLLAQGSGMPNPIVDLRQPISFRMLVHPTGEVTQPLAPFVSEQPGNRTVVEHGSTTLSASVLGSGPLSYQWRFNNQHIEGATNRFLELTNVQLGQAGNYSVFASNAWGTAVSSNGALTVTPAPFTEVLTPIWTLAPGERPYMTTDNNQRGIAYNPANDHLLLVSRSPSNAVHVLDGATGDYLHSLTIDTNVIRGGTIVLNMIAVTDDGVVYAANVTANGTTSDFRIYEWLSDDAATVPVLVWAGDPGLKEDGTRLTNRWGDTFVLRGSSANPQLLIGARANRVMTVLELAFRELAVPRVIEIPSASNGNFGFGLAFGDGDTVWCKGAGSAPLRLIQWDGLNSGTILQTFSGYSTLRAIGVHPLRKLLAGVSLETPDNLRLFDISDLTSGLLNIDTDFFPTDNANGNGFGAVAFGANRVYALDSNNGIIALELRSRLRFSRAGNQVRLTWQEGYILQSAATINGTFSDVSGATSPYDVDASTPAQRYYRLRQ